MILVTSLIVVVALGRQMVIVDYFVELLDSFVELLDFICCAIGSWKLSAVVGVDCVACATATPSSRWQIKTC